MAQNANREQWGMMPGYTDENGNPVYVNPQTGATRGVAGVKPIQATTGPPRGIPETCHYYKACLARVVAAEIVCWVVPAAASPCGYRYNHLRAYWAKWVLAHSQHRPPRLTPGKSPTGTLTMADIDAKAKANGMTREAVLADAQKQGYQIIK